MLDTIRPLARTEAPFRIGMMELRMADSDCTQTPGSTAQCWWQPYRDTGGIAVFHVDLTPNRIREANALAWLDKKEQARRNRFVHARPRREFGLCRAALRAILCNRLDCGNDEITFKTSEYGKPFALVHGIPACIHFNISHSGRHGLIALASTGRIGVDIEERILRLDLDGEIQTVLTPNERAELASVAGEQKVHLFFRLWTMKEALIKALGTGLSQDMSQFEIPSVMRHGTDTGVFCFPHMPAVRWKLENLDDPRFAAAIAHELDPDVALQAESVQA